MSYILQNGTSYCFIDSKKTILKTQNINSATRFTDSEKAFEQLRKATKKLKGFYVVDLKTNEKVEEIKKAKRKQFFQNRQKYDLQQEQREMCDLWQFCTF